MKTSKIEWAVFKRTGGGWIATPDPKVLKSYCWITAGGIGWYKEWGHEPVLFGPCKDIREVIEKVRKLG